MRQIHIPCKLQAFHDTQIRPKNIISNAQYCYNMSDSTFFIEGKITRIFYNVPQPDNDSEGTEADV